MSNIYRIDDYRSSDSAARSNRVSLAELAHRLRPPIPKENLLRDATKILIFHVSWGRNAWHSTWIARYTRNTFLPSMDTSTNFVNDRRVQGSSHRLLITPGWHLQFDGRAYIVGEINTIKPFERLRCGDFLQQGYPEEEMLRLLRPTSEAWVGQEPIHDSVIVQQTKKPSTDFYGWDERTAELQQSRTPGRYKRTIESSWWYWEPLEQPSTIDPSAFELICSQNMSS